MEHLTVFIPVIGGVLLVFAVISLLQTSLTDPGILPRATPDEAADIEKQIGKKHLGDRHPVRDRWGLRALPYGGSEWEVAVSRATDQLAGLSRLLCMSFKKQLDHIVFSPPCVLFFLK